MSVLATNLVPNPSVEVDTAGWTLPAGGARAAGTWGNRSWLFQHVTASATSTASAKVGASGAGTGLQGIPVSANGTYTVSAAAKVVAQSVTITALRLQVIEYDSAGGVLTTTTVVSQGAPVTGTIYNLSATRTVGATCAYIAVALFITAGAVGQSYTVEWDGVMVVAGSTVLPYFDGASPNCAWTGAADASTSTHSTADAVAAIGAVAAVGASAKLTATATAAIAAVAALAATATLTALQRALAASADQPATNASTRDTPV